eukprot:gnl/Chilomastix_caulleri/3006.p1 GENE.gnl/Chilomastix_caulleri/3006~~gnl/Chilomastix_caulleri/3006.p1  ORF type:complete len:106 (+),score=43.43 gnl/Chilomastix_caulleri/3006:75-392(+)
MKLQDEMQNPQEVFESLISDESAKTLSSRRTATIKKDIGPSWSFLDPVPAPWPRPSRYAEIEAASRIVKLMDIEVERNMITWDVADHIMDDIVSELAMELLAKLD